VDLEFEMPIILRRASLHLRGHKCKVAQTSGPLVYCLENTDNARLDIFHARIDRNLISAESTPALLGRIGILHERSIDNNEFTAIQHHLWANRGESKMTVWKYT
jgi:DUF1680 family protein